MNKHAIHRYGARCHECPWAIYSCRWLWLVTARVRLHRVLCLGRPPALGEPRFRFPGSLKELP